MTVECWAKLHSKRAFNVLVSSDPKSSSRHWEVYSYARSGAFSAYLPGYSPAEVVSKKDICDGKWHYLAMTFDGKHVSLYVDGEKVQEQTVAPRSGMKSVSGPLSVGQAIDGSKRIGCDGLIDDVRLSRVIRKISAAPAGPLPVDADTIGIWRFDDSEKILADPAWTPPPATTGEAWERATDVDWVDARLRKMDTGPTFNATMRYRHDGKNVMVYKATAIRIGEKGEGGVIFDRGQLRLAAGWTGGFLHHSDARFGLLNTPTPEGKMMFSTQSGLGWTDHEDKWENPNPPTLPLPRERGRFKGMYVHGKRVVLSYTVDGVEVRESPWLETINGMSVFVRTIEVGPHRLEMRLLAREMPGTDLIGRGNPNGTSVISRQPGARASLIVLLYDDQHGEQFKGSLKRFAIQFWRGSDRLRRYEILTANGEEKAILKLRDELLSGRRKAPPDLATWMKGGPARWTAPIVTHGEIAKPQAADSAPHVVDTLTVPYANPHNALFFLTGIDFMPNGDIAVCTAHGDVWLVKGADAKLDKLTWKRFATGLYQPLGLKVVDGKIIVLERGQLTRLDDLDGDGEADYYENLTNDWHTGAGEHSYDTCLDTDSQGRFYFFKTGDPHLPHGGCLLRASRDGAKVEVFATGFRHPIGLSVSPTDVVTGADQEGNWMPATRIDVYHKGGFYGDMRAHHRASRPVIYDGPLLWLPKSADNSAGGQVWIPHDHFGFPKGQMLHLSYGRCKLYAVLPQTVGDVQQAGAVDLGLFFLSGSMRGRFSPTDGHLYVVGLNGWQTAARRDGCLQRVRWTGEPVGVPTALSVHADGIRLHFARKLDAKLAADSKRYRVEQWNYRWTSDYGSKDWSVRQPEREGHDSLSVTSATVASGGKSVFLAVAGLVPAMQTRIGYKIQGADGKALVGAVYNTIHRLAPAAGRSAPAGDDGAPPPPGVLLDVALPPLGLASTKVKEPVLDIKGTSGKKYARKEDPDSLPGKALHTARVLLWTSSTVTPPVRLAKDVAKMRKELKLALKSLETRIAIPANPKMEAQLKNRVLAVNQSLARVVARMEDALEEMNKLAAYESKWPPRWRANFGLVRASLLLRIAHLEEWSLALGTLRKELPPHGKDDRAWQLTASTAIHDITAKKRIKEARQVLKQLQKDHPGTAWQQQAEHIGQTMLGVEWEAAK